MFTKKNILRLFIFVTCFITITALLNTKTMADTSNNFFEKNPEVKSITVMDINGNVETIQANTSRATTVSVVKDSRSIIQTDFHRNTNHPNYHPTWLFYGFHYGKLYVNGEVVFCIDMETPIPDGTGYSNAGDYEALPIATRLRINRIALFGYGYDNDTSDQMWWATQKLIWETMGWTADNTVWYGTSTSANVTTQINTIETRITNMFKLPSWNGKVIKAKTGDIVDLTDQYNSNFTFTVGNGLQITTNSGNTLKVKIVNPNGNLQIQAKKKASRIEGSPIVYSMPANQSVLLARQLDPATATVQLDLLEGDIKLTKKGTDGKNYSNVQFELSQNRSTILGTYTTGSNGSVTISNLEEGTYYVREKSVPNPLVIDRAWKTVTVTSGTTTSFTATNELAQGQIKVTKKSNTGSLIQNTKYNILNSSNQIVDSITTNASGVATSKLLPLGNYKVVETSVPAPYILDTTPITANLVYKDQTTSVVSASVTQTNNTAEGKITITKKSTNGTLVSGTVFEVFNSNNQLVDTLTTSNNGSITSKRLPIETYKIIEKSVPAPLVLDKTARTVTLSYKDQVTSVVTQSITVENKYQRSDLTLTKVENDWDNLFKDNNDKPLENAVISLYAQSDIYEGNTKVYSKDQKVGSATTNNIGKVTFNNLPVGDYYAMEDKAPTGYVLYEGKWNISIKYDSSNPTIETTNTAHTVTNQIVHGKSILHKTGKNGTVLLENANFGLFTENDELIGTFITNELGTIESPELRFGRYYWQELQAPVGYWLDTTKHYFEIQESDHEKEVHVVVANTFIEAKIKITKVDVETRETLEGVGFKILDENGDFVSSSYIDNSEVVTKNEWFTNQDGVIIIESNLAYGKYTLIESKALEGYNYIDPIDFIIDEHQNYINLDVIGNYLDLGEIENTKIYGNLTITKLDKETGLPINNVEFTIYSSDGLEIGKYTTNELGVIELKDIVYGEYLVVETYVPEPYFINPDNNSQTIFIQENEKDYYLTFENEKVLGKLLINKQDGKTNIALNNAEFVLYKAGEFTLEQFKENFEYIYDQYRNVIGVNDLGLIDLAQLFVAKGISNEEGSLQFENLDLGKYFLMEISSPLGYQLSNVIEELDILYKDYNSPIIEEEITILNNRTQVIIEGVKKDSLTKEVIKTQDFELTLKDSDGNVVELMKFENGIHYWLVDTFEKYYLSETKAPHGYQLSDEIIEIDTSLNLEDVVHTIEYLNSHLPDDELPPAGISNLAQEIAILFIILGGIFRYGKFKKQD